MAATTFRLLGALIYETLSLCGLQICQPSQTDLIDAVAVVLPADERFAKQ